MFHWRYYTVAPQTHLPATQGWAGKGTNIRRGYSTVRAGLCLKTEGGVCGNSRAGEWRRHAEDTLIFFVGDLCGTTSLDAIG